MDQLSTVSSTSAGFDKILSLNKQGTEPFKDLWPSEFKQFQEAVDSAEHRVAEGALVERLDAALSKSSGYDGIMKLKETVDSNEVLFALVPEVVRKREMARVQDRLEAELTLLMAGERLRNRRARLRRRCIGEWNSMVAKLSSQISGAVQSVGGSK